MINLLYAESLGNKSYTYHCDQTFLTGLFRLQTWKLKEDGQLNTCVADAASFPNSIC
jgi:hypothetical protein